MAHLPPQNVPGSDPFSQPKTLFLPAPGTAGVLVIRDAAGLRSRNKRFASAHAALDWCQAHRAALVFWPLPDPARN